MPNKKNKEINYKQANPLTSYQFMTIFEKVSAELYRSASGMSVKTFYGRLGHLRLNGQWVLFDRNGLYIDHDDTLATLAKRRKLDIH